MMDLVGAGVTAQIANLGSMALEPKCYQIYIGTIGDLRRAVLPLEEDGVLCSRWMVVLWVLLPLERRFTGERYDSIIY